MREKCDKCDGLGWIPIGGQRSGLLIFWGPGEAVEIEKCDKCTGPSRAPRGRAQAD